MFLQKEFISTQTHPYLIYPLCVHVRDIAIETSFEECKLQEPRFPVRMIKKKIMVHLLSAINIT